jgi:hypothetical protein
MSKLKPNSSPHMDTPRKGGLLVKLIERRMELYMATLQNDADIAETVAELNRKALAQAKP